jgi:hypothetical protein
VDEEKTAAGDRDQGLGRRSAKALNGIAMFPAETVRE